MSIEDLVAAMDDLEERIHCTEYGDRRDSLEAELEELLDSYVDRTE